MNELNPTKLQQDNTEQQIKFPKAKQHVGSMSKPHLGMTLFEVNTTTQEINPAKFEFTTLPVTEESLNPLPKRAQRLGKVAQLTVDQKVVHRRVIVIEGCWYVWAINKQNALKQYFRLLRQ
jgi:hypothetical protein